MLWPVGGRLLRGVLMEDSLRRKAKEECNLDLEDITYLGVGRAMWNTTALGHERGYDSFGFNYFAEGIGDLKLNDLHTNPTIITPDQYTSDFRKTLHPYMEEFMTLAMELIE